MTEDSNAPSILLFEVHKQNLQWLRVKFKKSITEKTLYTEVKKLNIH